MKNYLLHTEPNIVIENGSNLGFVAKDSLRLRLRGKIKNASF